MIKDKVEAAGWEFIDQTEAQAHMKFIEKVMKWEDCDFDEAVAICLGRTDPPDPEYTLGYKLSNPIMMMAMFYQPNKRKREQAIANFTRDLNPDELRIFEDQVKNEETRKRLRKEYKQEKKAKP